jgi:hypothetical protein
MSWRRVLSLALRCFLLLFVIGAIAIVSLAPARLLRGDRSMTATLREFSAAASWTGTAASSSRDFDPGVCLQQQTCDVFTLKVNIGKQYRERHPEFGLVIQAVWDDPKNDFNLYLYRDGQAVSESAQGRTNSEEVRLDVPPDGIYHVYTHASHAASKAGYTVEARIISAADVPPLRLARYVDDPQQPPAVAFSHSSAWMGATYRVYLSGDQRQLFVSKCAEPCNQTVVRRIFWAPAGVTLDHPYPVVALDRAGGLHVAFSDGESVLLLSSPDDGMTWKEAVAVNPVQESGIVYAAGPEITAGDLGKVRVTWTTQSGDVHDAWSPDVFAASPVFNHVHRAAVPVKPPGSRDRS